jgi:hypothetical protein
VLAFSTSRWLWSPEKRNKKTKGEKRDGNERQIKKNQKQTKNPPKKMFPHKKRTHQFAKGVHTHRAIGVTIRSYSRGQQKKERRKEKENISIFLTIHSCVSICVCVVREFVC